MATSYDGFPSLESPLVVPGTSRLAPAWYRFFVSLWARVDQDTNGFVGQMTLWPTGVAIPTGWLQCNGAAVSRTTYATLFALIGTTYGAGDGVTTFNVPNLAAYAGNPWIIRAN